ncbi:Protein kinase-like domain containing protein (HCD family) [Cryptosporidium felis]|nr:Protein kinase-like domain containing protein (HCD family) [Cryptosporidium felis]
MVSLKKVLFLDCSRILTPAILFMFLVWPVPVSLAESKSSMEVDQFSPVDFLSIYSNFPDSLTIKKFKFDRFARDPVSGTPEDREEYLELLSITKQFESTLLSESSEEILYSIQTELFCAQMEPVFKCLIHKPSSSDSQIPTFKTVSGFTWLSFKGTHAKVVAGYMTTPSFESPSGMGYQLTVDRYNLDELRFLHVDKTGTLEFSSSSKFSKLFNPTSTPLSNFKVYFHGSGKYTSGWLMDRVTVQVAIKGQVRRNSKSESLWDREKEYTLFLSSAEAWKTYNEHIYFVPGIFSLYTITNSGKSRLGGSRKDYSSKYRVISKQIVPSLNKSHLSEFLIMEYSSGMKFHYIQRRLKSTAAVQYYNLTDNWQDWFNNSLYLLFVGFSIISIFSTTGRYLYIHCDLHGGNIIVNNIPTFTLSRIIFSNLRKLLKIEQISIIDHMFVWTPKNIGDRNRSNPCTDIQHTSLSDTECLTALLLGPLFRWDYYPFESQPENTDNYKYINKKSLDLFEKIMDIPEWRRVSSYYIGGVSEWYHRWKRFGSKFKYTSINTFNEQFEGIMLVCDYLQKVMAENGIPQETPCVQFHSYLRGYSMLSYRAMRVGFCLRDNISRILSDIRPNQINRSMDIQISYWDMSRLSLLFYWNLLASNLDSCLPPHEEEEGFTFGFGEGLKAVLYKRHCNIVKECLLRENKTFSERFENVRKVKEEIHGYEILSNEPSETLKKTFKLFFEHLNKAEIKNFRSAGSTPGLQNLKIETILELNGNSGNGISSKAKDIIETKKTFDYEEFLLDRWIFNLYYQLGLPLSLTLVGLRYSFRVEPTLNGNRGHLNSIMKFFKMSATMQNLFPTGTNDMSENDLLLTCDMFYRTYYETSIQYYLSTNGKCASIIEEINSNPNYINFKSNVNFKSFQEEVSNLLFKNGKQKLFIIDPNYICTLDFLASNAKVTPNNEIIKQGFCDILIKPLSNIKISI